MSDILVVDDTFDKPELVLDRANGEFGIVFKSGLGTAKMAHCTNDTPAHFQVSSAVSACYGSPGSKTAPKANAKSGSKLAVLLKDGQIDFHFTSLEDMQDFLWALKELAAPMFTACEVPR
jgi:hypothetical protein